jgi:hypothetical protein
VKRVAAILLGLRALAIMALAGSPLGHAQETPSADDAAWAAARDSGSPDACQQYLRAFPTGRHAEEAFQCLIEAGREIAPDAGPDLNVY